MIIFIKSKKLAMRDRTKVVVNMQITSTISVFFNLVELISLDRLGVLKKR